MIEYSRSDIEYAINEWILNERNRNILKHRLLDGLTYERLSEEFDLSVQQIKNIVYKCQDRVFRHL